MANYTKNFKNDFYEKKFKSKGFASNFVNRVVQSEWYINQLLMLTVAVKINKQWKQNSDFTVQGDSKVLLHFLQCHFFVKLEYLKKLQI